MGPTLQGKHDCSHYENSRLQPTRNVRLIFLLHGQVRENYASPSQSPCGLATSTAFFSSRDPETRVGAAVGSWGVDDPQRCESKETPTRKDIGTDGGVGLRGEGLKSIAASGKYALTRS